MACTRFSTSQTEACRSSLPGVSKLFIANYADVTGYTLNSSGTTVTVLSMSGTSKFYPIALNKQVGAFLDTSSISLENGSAMSLPKVTFKVQSLSEEVMKMYGELLQSDVIVVSKTINGDLFIIGLANGLSMSSGTLGTEASATGFMGGTFELTGIEPKPFFKLDPTLNFETTYVVA